MLPYNLIIMEIPQILENIRDHVDDLVKIDEQMANLSLERKAIEQSINTTLETHSQIIREQADLKLLGSKSKTATFGVAAVNTRKIPGKWSITDVDKAIVYLKSCSLPEAIKVTESVLISKVPDKILESGSKLNVFEKSEDETSYTLDFGAIKVPLKK